MLLAYIDESYSRGYYCLATLLVPQDEVQSLTRALSEVVASAWRRFHTSGLTLGAELHGYDLFHAREDWTPLSGMARARIGVYQDAFEAIAAHDVSIVLRAVDRQRLVERYPSPRPPHEVVLEYSLESIDACARTANDLALVIADEVPEEAKHRENLRWYQEHSTSGYKAQRIERVVDTMHFVPSHASRCVQGADLIAFMYHRVLAVPTPDERAAKAIRELMSIIRPRIVVQRCWYP